MHTATCPTALNVNTNISISNDIHITRCTIITFGATSIFLADGGGGGGSAQPTQRYYRIEYCIWILFAPKCCAAITAHLTEPANVLIYVRETNVRKCIRFLLNARRKSERAKLSSTLFPWEITKQFSVDDIAPKDVTDCMDVITGKHNAAYQFHLTSIVEHFCPIFALYTFVSATDVPSFSMLISVVKIAAADHMLWSGRWAIFAYTLSPYQQAHGVHSVRKSNQVSSITLSWSRIWRECML